ncbi:MAG TPA: CapA family protein [Chloroflexota bacterium]|nr:CapA family protein [Chloroflexota bacterium]
MHEDAFHLLAQPAAAQVRTQEDRRRREVVLTLVTIAFVGDTLLGDQFQDLLRERGYDHPLLGIAPLLSRAAFTVVNLEGVLTAEDRGLPGVPQRTRFWMRADPESAAALAAYGVRLVSLANNHVLDYGLDGLDETISTLDAYGIAHCGAGATEAEARRPRILHANDVRVAFLSCIQRYDMYEGWLYAEGERGGCKRLAERTVSHDLPQLAEAADVSIVLAHWGRNYRDVTPAQERWAPRLATAGADLVIGHHPHIAQRVEILHGCPIVYSLGNGPFGTRGRFASYGQAPYGLVALAEIEPPGTLTALELHLIDVDNRASQFRPTPVEDETAIPFLRTLTAPADGWYQRGHALRLERSG